MKDSRMEEYWLLLSAISDIRSAIKDQASLWTLATILSQRGDVNRAFKYIRVSWDETKFFNAPLRNQQTLKGLSAIDEVYQAKIEKQNVSLRIYLTITIALAVMLAIAILLVYRQMNKLSVAHHSISVANRKLSESNKIKEEYIGRFLTLCSFYVDRLESFRTTIARKSRSGQLAEYLNDSKIKNMKDEDLANLLKSFDTAFLRLFPHFVSDFNALLAPDQQMKIAGDELLNTELRIFALIRLGVEDSSKIAEFLHYSANTIYNYRARIKKNSIVPREEFEKYVMKIGE
jgi:DNA-binding CsgD family transcriptional regulator